MKSNRIQHFYFNPNFQGYFQSLSSFFVIAILFLLSVSNGYGQTKYTWSHGGIIRGETTEKKLALIFSADLDAEGLPFIDSTFQAMDVKGSFFFTGNFFKRSENLETLILLLQHGNYIGSHSYGHLLYCDWTKRDSLLISHEEFKNDLDRSFAALDKYGIKKSVASYFLPPYEWYNDSISAWAKRYGLQIINFTPGTYSNADYTTPGMGKKYLSSDTIYNRILRYERNDPNGLNGFLLLIHAGTDPARTDKLYHKLPELIQYLRSKGYRFLRVDELLKN